jgi:uncharacterized protein
VLTRRAFLKSGRNWVAAAAGSGFYSLCIEPRWVEFVRRPLAIRGLPTALAGCTLVQISDVHVGRLVEDDYVLATFREIAELRPDIVVMTGDFVSYHAGVFKQMRRVYRHFPRGRLATLAILGNHDYGPDWAHPEIAQRVVDTVRPCGITVLRNEAYEVAGIQIVGLDDLWAHQFEPERVLPHLEARRPAIVLTHNPDTVDLPVWNRHEGWILAGHTHGGQVKPPFLPPPIVPVHNRRYTAGEFALSGNRRLYINRGVGFVLPVRFNVRPEVTLFELRPA